LTFDVFCVKYDKQIRRNKGVLRKSVTGASGALFVSPQNITEEVKECKRVLLVKTHMR
jgi:hypothetical protein